MPRFLEKPLLFPARASRRHISRYYLKAMLWLANMNLHPLGAVNALAACLRTCGPDNGVLPASPRALCPSLFVRSPPFPSPIVSPSADCLPTHLSACLPACLPARPSNCLPVCLRPRLPDGLSSSDDGPQPPASLGAPSFSAACRRCSHQPSKHPRSARAFYENRFSSFPSLDVQSVFSWVIITKACV